MVRELENNPRTPSPHTHTHTHTSPTSIDSGLFPSHSLQWLGFDELRQMASASLECMSFKLIPGKGKQLPDLVFCNVTILL